MSLSISLFGRLQIYIDGSAKVEESSTKARELLAYLLLHRSRAHPREKIASILWGRVTKESSLAYLRKALWKLRKVLDREGRPFLLRADREWIEVNPEVELWLDVARFERAFERTRDTAAADLTGEEATELKRCAGLYVGDLLENWYQGWCAMERSRLRNFYLIILDKLADYCEVKAEYDSGVQWALRALQLDPARECTHRRIMRLRYRAGDRTGALRQYRQCTETLEEQLDVSPSSETERLRRRIRRDRELPHPVRRSASWNGNGFEGAEGSGLEQLRELERTLSSLRAEVRQQIEAVEYRAPDSDG